MVCPGRVWCTLGILLVPAGLMSGSAHAELLGYVGGQVRWFPSDGLDPRQVETQISTVLAPEWFTHWNDGDDSVTVSLFYRYDADDEKRSRGDVRELYWQHVGHQWELTMGIKQMFWGVTESQHLVDIINQIDLVEAVDGEEKLGQTVVHLALLRDWGTLDLLLLPGFRERTFPGTAGRLRTHPVTVEAARYESASGDDHVDLAARWSHDIGAWSLGVSAFTGTSRDPLIRLSARDGAAILQPLYPQIHQFGLELQYLSGDWFWKAEGSARDYQDDALGGDDFGAMTAGFEYTHVALFDTSWDLGLLAEYSADTRETSEGALLQNDLFAGLRLSFNDLGSSEILLGGIQDLDRSGSRSVFVEASTRFGNATRVAIDLFHFSADAEADALHAFSRDSYLEISLNYHF